MRKTIKYNQKCMERLSLNSTELQNGFLKEEIKVTDKKNFNLRRLMGILRNLHYSEQKDQVEAPQSTYRRGWQSNTF